MKKIKLRLRPNGQVQGPIWHFSSSGKFPYNFWQLWNNLIDISYQSIPRSCINFKFKKENLKTWASNPQGPQLLWVLYAMHRKHVQCLTKKQICPRQGIRCKFYSLSQGITCTCMWMNLQTGRFRIADYQCSACWSHTSNIRIGLGNISHPPIWIVGFRFLCNLQVFHLRKLGKWSEKMKWTAK